MEMAIMHVAHFEALFVLCKRIHFKIDVTVVFA